ncbi:DUF6553 family protein [Butyrivibrio proteoclasticus]|uniref:DUF6553 family protein n=1 Tax=Butyrivibrio proteoclasticus TaxID=43305 RepID=UPI00047C9917|nr:DUF6553 family protein [Butyrivibrio proteoclasticus]
MTHKDNDDRYSEQMKAWLMIQTMGQISVSFFNKKKLTKELMGYLEAFPQDGKELTDFAEYFVDACLHSRKYGTTIFGMVPMSEGGTATRLLEDIDLVTRDIPEKFGCAEAFGPLREALLSAHKSQT